MNLLIYTLGLLLAAFAVHVGVWKNGLPCNHSKSLMIIFIGVLAAATLVAAVFQQGFDLVGGLNGYIQIAWAYLAVMLAYVVTYSGIEVDSPSLVMVLEIAAAGVQGYDQQRLYQLMDNDRLVSPRVNDLLNGEMVVLQKGFYFLTPKGKRVARLFCFYRRVLKRERKGG